MPAWPLSSAGGVCGGFSWLRGSPAWTLGLARVAGGPPPALAAVALLAFRRSWRPARWCPVGFLVPFARFAGIPWCRVLEGRGVSGESHARLWVDDDDALGRRLPC